MQDEKNQSLKLEKRNSFQRNIFRRKYRIGLIIFLIFLFAGSVHLILRHNAELKQKAGEEFIRKYLAPSFQKEPEDLTDEDFAKNTSLRLLYPIGELIDLTFLKKFTNLNKFTFYEGAVTIPQSKPVIPRWKLLLSKLGIIDLEDKGSFDLKPIGELTKLEEVGLGGPMISDIKPLSKLTNLKSLHLSITQVTDLKPIKDLINLQELLLGDSPVSSLEPIKGLINLKNLEIIMTQVSDLGSIRNLINIEKLYISDSPISDLQPIRGLKNLKILTIINTQVSDLEPVKNLTNLRKIDLRGCKQITDKQLEDLHKALPNLEIER